MIFGPRGWPTVIPRGQPRNSLSANHSPEVKRLSQGGPLKRRLRESRPKARLGLASRTGVGMIVIAADVDWPRPTRFERVTFAFGGQGSLQRLAPPKNLCRSVRATGFGRHQFLVHQIALVIEHGTA